MTYFLKSLRIHQISFVFFRVYKKTHKTIHPHVATRNIT